MPQYLSPGVYVEEIEAGSRPIEGVGTAVAALIRDRVSDADGGRLRKVSLRASDDRVDVSRIARVQGGGGHRQAAGFSSDASIEEITEFIQREFLASAPTRA